MVLSAPVTRSHIVVLSTPLTRSLQVALSQHVTRSLILALSMTMTNSISLALSRLMAHSSSLALSRYMVKSCYENVIRLYISRVLITSSLQQSITFCGSTRHVSATIEPSKSPLSGVSLSSASHPRPIPRALAKITESHPVSLNGASFPNIYQAGRFINPQTLRPSSISSALHGPVVQFITSLASLHGSTTQHIPQPLHGCPNFGFSIIGIF